MNDIEQAVNAYTDKVIKNTLKTVNKVIAMYTDKKGMVDAKALNGALEIVFYEQTAKGDSK